MARKSIYAADTNTKLSDKPNVDTTPLWHSISIVFIYHFLTSIINKAFQ